MNNSHKNIIRCKDATRFNVLDIIALSCNSMFDEMLLYMMVRTVFPYDEKAHIYVHTL